MIWRVVATLATVGVTLFALAPLPTSLLSATVPNTDVYGNSWALAWIAHQLIGDPRHLFDANMFYPLKGTLGFTETMFPVAVLAAPLHWFGVDALTVHNIVVVLSFPLVVLATYLLALELSGSRPASLLAGLANAFSAYRYDHIVHVQTLTLWWLPLALLFTIRSLRSNRPVHAFLAGAFSLFQALSSGYYAVLLVPALLVAIACYGIGAQARGRSITLIALSGAALLAFVALLPHKRAIEADAIERGYRIERRLGELQHWSARWTSYLDPGRFSWAPPRRWLAERNQTGEPLYPAALILIGATIGLLTWRRQPRAVACIVGLIVLGVLLSLGPTIHAFGASVPGPYLLLRELPGGTSLRTPARMGALALLGFSVLGAMGWAHFMRNRRSWVWAALTGLLVMEIIPVGLPIRSRQPVPPTAAWLASAPEGAVLELPWDHQTAGNDGQYLYWSTFHWKPLVNGWGGFYPKGPFELGVRGRQFPAPNAAQDLRRAGIRYVVVHKDRIPSERVGQLRKVFEEPIRAPGVRLAADFGADRIFELVPDR